MVTDAKGDLMKPDVRKHLFPGDDAKDKTSQTDDVQNSSAEEKAANLGSFEGPIFSNNIWVYLWLEQWWLDFIATLTTTNSMGHSAYVRILDAFSLQRAGTLSPISLMPKSWQVEGKNHLSVDIHDGLPGKEVRG